MPTDRHPPYAHAAMLTEATVIELTILRLPSRMVAVRQTWCMRYPPARQYSRQGGRTVSRRTEYFRDAPPPGGATCDGRFILGL